MSLFKLNILFVLGVALMSSGSLHAQIIVNIDSGFDNQGNLNVLYDSNNSTPLATGDLVQFGYFSGATGTTTPFAGTFIPLTSNGTEPVTLIGQDPADTGAGPGSFFYSGLNLSSDSNIPGDGTIMSFVIYNASTAAAATDYAAAADLSVPWSSASEGPFGFPQNFSLGDANIAWKDNVVGYTGIATGSPAGNVPEPRTDALLAASLLAWVAWSWARMNRRMGGA